jgi:hypothetical protein
MVERLAQAVAAELQIPIVDLLTRTEARPPQRAMANAVQQAANVRGAFAVIAPAGPWRWSGGSSERRAERELFRSCSERSRASCGVVERLSR